MATTDAPKTLSELVASLLNRVRAQTTLTANATEAKRLLNEANMDIHVGLTERATWAERKDVLVTHPVYSTGTIAISKGGTILTGTGTDWSASNVFGQANARVTGRIKIDGSNDLYEIASVDSATQITLGSRFTGETLTTGTYTYFEDEYALHADFLRPISVKFFDDARSITIMDRRQFDEKFPRPLIQGKPQVACIRDVAPSGNTTPVRRIQLWRPPNEAFTIPYRFITSKLAISSAGAAQENMTADSDEPILPYRFRRLLVLHALAAWYRDKRDDARSGEVQAEYADFWLRTFGDMEIGQTQPRLRARTGAYKHSASSPYSGRRRLITGNRFDSMLD
jgi:hypothetical protein